MGKKGKKILKNNDIGTYVLITILFALIGYLVVKFFIADNVAPFVSEYVIK